MSNFLQCLVCGKTISRENNNQKYCQECSKHKRHLDNIEKAKRYRERNPYQYKKINCAVCGKLIEGVRGGQKYCETCGVIARKQYREQYDLEHKDTIVKRNNEWYLKNKNLVTQQHKKWRELNPDYFDLRDNKRRFGGLRNEVLIRDNYKCQVCGSEKQLDIHHKKYINEMVNLITLCKSCHKKVHREIIKL
jgi:predicted nucleic acid-binding Zn ribbon protein